MKTINVIRNSKIKMNHFSFFIFIFTLLFVSCSKEEGGQNPDGTYTFNLAVEDLNIRAAVTMNRYVMEMYKGDLTATPVRMTNANGIFTVEMIKNIDYICLFWADNGTDYDVTSLKSIKQVDETVPGTVAYSANMTINTKTFNGAILLKRAVAQLSFIDKNGLTEATNTLKITYPYSSATLNVGDGTVRYAAGSAVRTITNIAPPAAATDAFTADYILAPTVTDRLIGLKLQLNAELEKNIVEAAIKANVKTNITGEYQPKPAPVDAHVGDFYYSDKTYSSTLKVGKTCIGIVFVVNADSKSGKIVSLSVLV